MDDVVPICYIVLKLDLTDKMINHDYQTFVLSCWMPQAQVFLGVTISLGIPPRFYLHLLYDIRNWRNHPDADLPHEEQTFLIHCQIEPICRPTSLQSRWQL
jgi:hypothetical protein